jgi:type I restriction enzyme S subunit
MRIDALPTGWSRVKIGDVALVNERDPGIRELPDTLEVTFLPMAAIDALSGRIATPQVRLLSEVRKGFTSFSEGDVLFAKITPSMENGKAAVAHSLQNHIGFGSTEFHVMRPSAPLLPKYLFYFVRQETFRQDAKRNFVGTAGQMRVPASFLEDYTIPLPPILDQQRIVEKIEELFSELDEATEELEQALAKLKRYRASVLAAACSGKLVPTEADLAKAEGRTYETGADLLARTLKERREKWAGRGKYKEPAGPDTASLPSLPEGWTWASLGDLFEVYVGATPSRSQSHYWNGGIPWVSSGEVSFRTIRETKETISESGFENSSTVIHPAGTVMLGMIGEGKTRGQAAILGIPAAHNQNTAAIRVSQTMIPPEYVYRYLEGRYEITRRIGSGNNQPALNKRLVEGMPIPLPPLAEIQRVVFETERRLSVVDQSMQDAAESIRRAEALRQSILQQAFSGMLVPQEEGVGTTLIQTAETATPKRKAKSKTRHRQKVLSK